MTKTIDEWVEDNAPRLKTNLEANIKVFCEEMSQEEKETLLRLHLIMVRDWAQDKGVV